jgi:hypothetical protein
VCGHGRLRGDSDIDLICSYNQRFGLEEIVGIVQKSGYNGTLIQMVNVCMEDDSLLTNITPQLPHCCHTCSVLALSLIEDIYDKYDGSIFFKCLKEVVSQHTVDEKVYMLYEKLQDLSNLFPRCTVSFSTERMFNGLFFGDPVACR